MGSGVQWQAMQWSDGTLYEGLVKDNSLEPYGVAQFQNGDSIYRGQWTQGLMHGCGVKIWRDNGVFKAAAGKFVADDYVGPVMSCDQLAADDAAVEADVTAEIARAFQTEHGSARRRAAAQARLRPGPNVSRLHELPEKDIAALRSTVDGILSKEVGRLTGFAPPPTQGADAGQLHPPAVPKSQQQHSLPSWSLDTVPQAATQPSLPGLDGAVKWLQSVLKWGNGMP